MKVVLINDTSGTSNPGCQGTVHCLVEGLREHGAEFISRVPIGHAYELFRNSYIVPPSPSLLQRLKDRVWRRGHGVPQISSNAFSRRICPEAWQKAVGAAQARLAPSWTAADLLVVNGEGTIHHQMTGALVLLGLCLVAKRLGKRVALVNCSINDLDDTLIEALRDSVDYLSVREPLTQRYLETFGISSVLSADCLFLAKKFAVSEHGVSQEFFGGLPYTLYTPGVLAASNKVEARCIAADLTALRDLGDPVIYHVVEAEDERFCAIAHECGAKILPLGSVCWRRMAGLLSNARLVVSGRYHINIFAALAGKPFIPMETNTPKMAGVLELLSPDQPVRIRQWGTAEKPTDPLDLDIAFAVSRESVARCVEFASMNFSCA